MSEEEIEDLGRGAMFIGGIEQVDLSGLERLIILLETAGSTEEVEVQG